MADGSLVAQVVVNKRKVGRPSHYTPELAGLVCELVATTPKGLKAICESDPRLPWKSTVNDWVDKFPEFASRLARARELQAYLFVEECVEIADTLDIGEETVKRGDNLEVRRGDMLAHRRLRIQTRLDVAAKMAPKVFGNKLDLSGNVSISLEHLVLASIQQPMFNVTPPKDDNSYDDLL